MLHLTEHASDIPLNVLRLMWELQIPHHHLVHRVASLIFAASFSVSKLLLLLSRILHHPSQKCGVRRRLRLRLRLLLLLLLLDVQITHLTAVVFPSNRCCLTCRSSLYRRSADQFRSLRNMYAVRKVLLWGCGLAPVGFGVGVTVTVFLKVKARGGYSHFSAKRICAFPFNVL